VSVVESWKNPLWMLGEFVQGLHVGFSSGILGFAALLVFGAGLVSYARSDYRLLVLFVVPCALGGAVTLAVGHHLWPRFFFFAFGFAVLILVRGVMFAAKGVGDLAGLSPKRSAWLGTLLCIALILVSGASMVFAYGPKQDYSGALAFVDMERRPGDQVVTVDIAGLVYDRFYHAGWQTVESLDELNLIRSGARRTWLVYTFPTVLQATQPAVMAVVERDFSLVKEFPGTVREGTLFVSLYEPPSSGSSPGEAQFHEARYQVGQDD
jgi:hypothetical protein